MKRRTLLKSIAGVAGLIGLPYSLWRGVRYPRLSLETPALSREYTDDNITLQFTDCFAVKNAQYFELYEKYREAKFLRAYAPEPKIHIQRSAKPQTLVINNLSPEAIIDSPATVDETIIGITRIITIPATQEATTIAWNLPLNNDYEFAAIGDSGGSDELGWCIHRAQQLGAHFFIHLGDFHYQASDYESAVKYFIHAPLPCYITIGNHDFHDNGLIVDHFLDDIGPLNHHFTLNNVRYVNLDTAASFLPVSGGKRADLVKAIVEDKTAYDDTVLFTHRSFYDPRPGEDHDLGNVFEKNWLVKSLKLAKIDTIIAGHIHSYHETESEDIRIFIAGQGLAHEDLIHQRQVAKMLVGRVVPGQKVAYRAEGLNMPFELHCHPYISKWRKDNDDPFAEKINDLCAPIDARNNKA